jgi:hypothetical protein
MLPVGSAISGHACRIIRLELMPVARYQRALPMKVTPSSAPPFRRGHFLSHCAPVVCGITIRTHVTALAAALGAPAAPIESQQHQVIGERREREPAAVIADEAQVPNCIVCTEFPTTRRRGRLRAIRLSSMRCLCFEWDGGSSSRAAPCRSLLLFQQRHCPPVNDGAMAHVREAMLSAKS